MNKLQIQSLPYVLTTDNSMWCGFFSPCVYYKKWKIEKDKYQICLYSKILLTPKIQI